MANSTIQVDAASAKNIFSEAILLSKRKLKVPRRTFCLEALEQRLFKYGNPKRKWRQLTNAISK